MLARKRLSWHSRTLVPRQLALITIPQRLLLISAVTFVGVFAILAAYGRAGLGIGQGFYLPVVLAAAATSPSVGALAGGCALFLYELGIHDRGGLAWADLGHGSAVVRLACYVAVGVVIGFLARRGRLMLADSLHVLEELVDIAYGNVDARRAEAGTAENETLPA